MRKSLLTSAAFAFLFLTAIVCKVRADGYEVETVGGVVSPTNLVISLTQAVILSATIIGFVIVTACVRIRKTN